ncbi:MAG: DUF5615 family PIN-like protein [Tepidiformaceae bacterium]
MTTLYTDEDSSRRALVSQWRLRGGTVWTPAEVDRLGYPDGDQLAFAADRGWVILTCNVQDYARLSSAWIRAGRVHAGLIISYRTATGRRPSASRTRTHLDFSG